MLIYAIIIFLLGLCVGSFLNVLIYRADELKNVLNTRSKCMHCKKAIKWYDLVPLVSFILLRGRCRNCGKEISWQYPIVEAATALLFLMIYLTYGLEWISVYYAIMIGLMLVIFVYDLKTQYILDTFSWTLLIIAILGSLFIVGMPITDLIYGMLAGGGMLAILVIISREKWMGMGDVIIGSAMGAMLGYPLAISFIFIAFILGSLVGMVLIALKRKKIKDAVPFAPFLVLSALINLFIGQYIIDWYIGTIFLK